jgi:hypothetical protein
MLTLHCCMGCCMVCSMLHINATVMCMHVQAQAAGRACVVASGTCTGTHACLRYVVRHSSAVIVVIVAATTRNHHLCKDERLTPRAGQRLGRASVLGSSDGFERAGVT